MNVCLLVNATRVCVCVCMAREYCAMYHITDMMVNATRVWVYGQGVPCHESHYRHVGERYQGVGVWPGSTVP